MKRTIRSARLASAVAGCLLLSACAGGRAPDWASNAHASLERFEAAWLRGDSRVAQSEFERARKPVVEGLKSRFENNGFWLEAISQSQSRTEWLEWTRTLRADFESITLDEVKGAAGGLFDPARALRVRVVADGTAKAP